MLYIVLWRTSPARDWDRAEVFTDRDEALDFTASLRVRGWQADIMPAHEPNESDMPTLSAA